MTGFVLQGIYMKIKKINLSFLLIIILLIFSVFGFILVYQQTSQSADYQLFLASPGQPDEKDFAKITNAFPNEEKVIDLVSIISQAQGLFAEFVFGFDSDTPLVDRQQPYLPLTITTIGSQEKSVLFINQLLNAPYLLAITNLQVKSQDGFINDVEMVVKANLYVSESFR